MNLQSMVYVLIIFTKFKFQIELGNIHTYIVSLKCRCEKTEYIFTGTFYKIKYNRKGSILSTPMFWAGNLIAML